MSGARAGSLKHFSRFAWLAYWPVGLFVVFFGWGYLLSLPIRGSSREASGGAADPFVVQGGLALLVPVLIVIMSYWLCSKSPDWKRRGWIIYLSWLPLALLIGFVFSAGMGGASQAVAEGAAGSAAERNLLYWSRAIKSLVAAQLFVVPVVLFAVRSLKRSRQWE